MTTGSTTGTEPFAGSLEYDRARDTLTISFEGGELSVPAAQVRAALQCDMRIERVAPGTGPTRATVRFRRSG